MRAPRTRVEWIAAALIAAVVTLGVIVMSWLGRHAFAVDRLTRGVGDTTFYSGDGRPWFRMDEQRLDVRLEEISPYLQRAVIAIEDHRFFQHPGIDPIAVGRAVVRNLRSGSAVEGASTLSQQLARTLFLSNVKTWGRKTREAVLAVMIEQRLTKKQILELYLNRIYISGGVYGVEAMSRKLYGKPARSLSLSEAALIAGMIRSPATLSPWSHSDAALRRSHRVLARMREQGVITTDEEARARQSPPRIRPYPVAVEARAGYAKEYLRQLFREQFGGDRPPEWQVHTTLLPDVQDAAERAVDAGLARLNRPELQAALVALDPSTGNVLALVGGRDYRLFPYNRAVRSRRQPGSAFKPFVYAVALDQGASPVTLLSGLSAIAPMGREEWLPANARGDNPDELTLRAALLESDNRAAVALQRRVGTQPVLRLAKDAGLADLPNVPSLALGTGLATPMELTAAFAVFPNGGYAVEPRAIRQVLDGRGSVQFWREVERRRVVSPEVAFQMVSMLQDVVDRGTASAARQLGVRGPVGGKTGTTDDFRDAWFVGFSSAVVAGVWVGFDQPQPIGRDAYAARVALPIWSDFMRRVARRLPPQPSAPPAGMRDEELCRVTYLKPVEECPTYVEHFKEGDDVPGRRCPLHQGTLKQRVARAVEGLLSNLGKRLKGIFGR